MAVIKRRGATKKLGPVGLDRKYVSFKVSGTNRHFTVHEDLLCKNSKYFRKLLQKDRKSIDGICSICHENLDPEVDDLTFCRWTCGQNFHEKCNDGQKNSRAGPMSCPICRKPWKLKADDLVLVGKPTNVDRDSIQSYVEWFYTGNMGIIPSGNRGSQNFNISILGALTVAIVFQDIGSKSFLIAEYFSSIEEEEEKSSKAW